MEKKEGALLGEGRGARSPGTGLLWVKERCPGFLLGEGGMPPLEEEKQPGRAPAQVSSALSSNVL